MEQFTCISLNEIDDLDKLLKRPKGSRRNRKAEQSHNK